MRTKLFFLGILILAEGGMGYYSIAVNGSLFSRFLFFLLSAGIVSLLVIRGIRYLVPNQNYDEEKRASTKKSK